MNNTVNWFVRLHTSFVLENKWLMDAMRLIFVSQEVKQPTNLLIVMEIAQSHVEILKFCVTVRSSTAEKKKVAKQKILAIKKPEMSMVNTALIILTHMNVQLLAPKIPTSARPEQTLTTAKNKLHAPPAPRMLTTNVVHQLLTALLFANPMKKNAKSQD